MAKKTGNKKTETKKNKPKRNESKNSQSKKNESKKIQPKKIKSIEPVTKTSVKPKTLNKKLRLLIPLIVIICVIGLVWIFFISDSAKADEPTKG